MKTFFALLLLMLISASAADTKSAAAAINALGVDLYRVQAKGDGNLLLSPYSIETALAMTYAGADGETRAEMRRTLHFVGDVDALHGGFAGLADDMRKIASNSVERVAEAKRYGGFVAPIEFNAANRLFVQQRFALRAPFLELVKDRYHATPELLDFTKEPAARARINGWVEEQTRNKIRDLIPPRVLDDKTRLVLVNALYLRAPWAKPFSTNATKKELFHAKGGAAVPVATMSDLSQCGYAKHPGFQIVTRPYGGNALQFVILLPDKPDGLRELEQVVTPKLLSDCARLPAREVVLHLPKFRIEPPTLRLAGALQSLGMKTAFDQPLRSANFDRMAPRKRDEYLFIGEVVHKTFLALDEEGTEAAAATEVVMPRPTGIPLEKLSRSKSESTVHSSSLSSM